MSKGFKITLIIASCIFILLGTVLTFWYFGDTYKDFYSKAKKEFEIPGLSEGFIPQGITHNKEENVFLACGYMKDGSASRIYVIDKDYKTTKYFTLKTDGNPYVGHAGGIATNGTTVWVCGDKIVNRFNFSDIKNVKNGGSIDILDSFNPSNGADFVTVVNGSLWVGEFQKDGKYDVPESHFIENADGSINKAISFCYEIQDNSIYGIRTITPTIALSTPSLVQGMVIKDNKVMISTSYSIPNSHLYIYDKVFESTNKSFNYNGTNIPLFVLNSENLTETIEAPAMSEELVLVNDRAFIMFESACKKYAFVNREPLRHAYSIKF